MPTVLDSLIVTVGLDASEFSRGQKKLLEDLRKLQEQGGRSAERYSKVFASSVAQSGQDFGSKVRLLYTALQNPMRATHEGLLKLSSQSLRTGEAVAAGALRGGAAFTALAGAALLVLGALKGVQSLATSIQTTFGSNVLFQSMWAGVPSEWMTELSAAVYQKYGAPQEQTQQWILGLQEKLQAFVTPGSTAQGQFTPFLENLVRLGVNPVQFEKGKAAVPAILMQLSEALSKLDKTQIPMIAEQLGMSVQLAQLLAEGPAAVRKAMKVESGVAIKEQQSQALLRLQQAWRQLSLDSQNLERDFTTEISPILIGIIKLIDFFIRAADVIFKGIAYTIKHPIKTIENVISFLMRFKNLNVKDLWQNPLGFTKEFISTIFESLKSSKEFGGISSFEGLLEYFLNSLGLSTEGSLPKLKSSGFGGLFGAFSKLFASKSDEDQYSRIIRSPRLLPSKYMPNQVDVIQTMHSFLLKEGFNPQAIAGILANAQAESSFNPGASGPGGAFGLFQWEPERQKKYAQMFGHSMQTEWAFNPSQALLEQLQFMVYELRTDYGNVYNRLINAVTPFIGAYFMAEGFEKPAAGQEEATRRGMLAEQMFRSIYPLLSNPLRSTGDQTSITNKNTDININVNVSTPPGADANQIGNTIGDIIANKLKAMNRSAVTNLNVGHE